MTSGLSQEQYDDLRRNFSDPNWRLRNLYWILDKDGNKASFPPAVMLLVEPVVHRLRSDPEGERAPVNQGLVVLRPVDDEVKRLAHGADTNNGIW